MRTHRTNFKSFPRQIISFHLMLLLRRPSSFITMATVVISGIFSVATAVIFTVPSVSHFVLSCFPIIYDNTVFLLKPPYLYLVINCIIFSIVATSKLTHKSSSSDDSEISQFVTPVPVPEPIHAPSDIDTSYLNVVHVASDYTGFVKNNDVKDDAKVEDVQKIPEVIAHGEEQHPETETPKQSSNLPEIETEMSIPKDDLPEIPILKSSRKPPRFNQQKSLQTNPEGVYKKMTLGISKPPREDTLETTWKKITEGRSTPLTKHLTKSDTWRERGHVQSSSEKQKKAKVTKSDNLNDRNVPMKKTRLRHEPSPGQEELNQRVEAFIKKFNEEMRLQRLESLAKYNEMVVNGGTRL